MEIVGGDLCVEVINQLFELEDRLVQIENGRRGNLHDHINEFNRLVCQLLSVEEKLSNEEQAIALLAFLSQSYKSLVRSMLIGKNTIKLLDDVTTVLREDQRMHRDDHIIDGRRILALESSQRGRNNFGWREGQQRKST